MRSTRLDMANRMRAGQAADYLVTADADRSRGYGDEESQAGYHCAGLILWDLSPISIRLSDC
jgi:hypothetical protein